MILSQYFRRHIKKKILLKGWWSDGTSDIHPHRAAILAQFMQDARVANFVKHMIGRYFWGIGNCSNFIAL
jgi:hypothetical protein